MTHMILILLLLACVAVVLSLVLGVFVMSKGGEASKKYSNKLMQARVMLQGLALILFVLAAFSVRHP